MNFRRRSLFVAASILLSSTSFHEVISQEHASISETSSSSQNKKFFSSLRERALSLLKSIQRKITRKKISKDYLIDFVSFSKESLEKKENIHDKIISQSFIAYIQNKIAKNKPLSEKEMAREISKMKREKDYKQQIERLDQETRDLLSDPKNPLSPEEKQEILRDLEERKHFLLKNQPLTAAHVQTHLKIQKESIQKIENHLKSEALSPEERSLAQRRLESHQEQKSFAENSLKNSRETSKMSKAEYEEKVIQIRSRYESPMETSSKATPPSVHPRDPFLRELKGRLKNK